MIRILTALLTGFSAIAVPLAAQDTLSLTVADAVASAMKNNRELTMASLDEQQSEAKYKETNAIFLPQINISYAAMNTNNPLQAFGFKLQQESITAADFNPEVLNNPSASSNFMTRAAWQQPLLNADMLYMRKAADEQRTVYAYRTQRTKEHLLFRVQQAFAQLQLAWQAKEVTEQALQSIRSVYVSTQNRFEKGYLQKSDVLNVQVQIAAAESQAAVANSNVLNASDQLGFLMGVKKGVVYRVDQPLVVGAFDQGASEVPDARADFRAMQAALDAQALIIKSGKMSYLPKLNGFAEFYINDKQALGFGSTSYLAGVQLSMTLFNGMATQKRIAGQRLERDKTAEQLKLQMEQSQLELDKTIRQRDDARMSLKQFESAVIQATEALRIQQNRYHQGLVDTNTVLQSHTQLLQQQLGYAQAVFSLNTTEAYLDFLTTTGK